MSCLLSRKSTSVIGGCFLALAVLVSTGCMVTPGDGEVVQDRGSIINVVGAGLNPNDTVEIQARLPGYGIWETVGTTRTLHFASSYFGVDFYIYATDVTIPPGLWKPNDECYQTEVRAIDSTGSLVTFEAGFGDYFGDYDISEPSELGRMYSDHGAGRTAIICTEDL